MEGVGRGEGRRKGGEEERRRLEEEGTPGSGEVEK